MEISTNDTSHHSPPTYCNDVANHNSPMPPDVANQGSCIVHDHLRGMEYKHEIGGEEARTILEVIASTGKFWHDWNKLKTLLSVELMQVLSEYPEAKMTSEQQCSSLGETYPELAKRLVEALLSFAEGPPFTLQRLCEILLSSRSIYPNLSKLALALQKNLLVTSTLTISADPYPPSLMQKPEEIDKRGEEPQERDEEPQENASSEQNGLEQLPLNEDEVMTEVVEEADVGDEMTMEVEAFAQIVGPSESNSIPTTES